MHRIRPPTSVIALLAISMAFAPGALAAPPRPALTATELTIESVTPGGVVALLAVERQDAGYGDRLIRWSEIFIDEDQDGRLEVPLEEPPAGRSVWVVVDLASGELAVTSPAGAVRPGQLPPGAVVSGGAALRRLGRYLDLLLVRPGETSEAGAWSAWVADGGPGDADGRGDHALEVGPAALGALGASPPPPLRFRPGDVLVVIDTDRLETFVAHLPAADAPGGSS